MKRIQGQSASVVERGRLRCLALSAFVPLLWACQPSAPQFKGIDITGADYARGFSLRDHNGQLRSMKDFAGKVVVIFFGYTHCPDVCPTSMLELSEVKKKLGAQGDALQVIFITVDPERDSPELLKAYMDNFDPSFLALRPEPQDLPDLAKQFKVYYKRVEGKTPSSYTMDHTAGSYVYDRTGRVRLFNRYNSGIDQVVADVSVLLKSS